MKPNAEIRNQIMQVVENQMKMDDPPETNQTYKRLIRLGFNEFDSKAMIGQCVAVEIFNIMKFRNPFDEQRFIKNLNKLPEEPFE
ncbi:MAG: hypothetical protein KBC43_00495 [Bacteroidales bacterium]|nr:hypothetical protein [Bacteroidales bacterium]